MPDLAAPANVTEAYRASPQQRHVWRLRSLRPQTADVADAIEERRPDGAYQVTWVVDVDGVLDASRLGAALASLTRRFEICRTEVRCPAGFTQPLQYVPTRGPAVADGLLPRFAGGSLTAELIGHAARRHQLRLAMPAECADAYTPEILTRELAAAYGREPESHQPAVQFVDVSAMLNEMADSDTAGAGAAFWRQQLTAGPLPWGDPRARAGTPFRPRWIPVPWNAAVGSPLMAGDPLASQTALLAGWIAYLTRAWNTGGITVATTRNARAHDDIVSTPGPLAWMLPFRIDVAPGDSLLQLRDRVAGALDAGSDWQHGFDWDRIGSQAALLDALPLVGFQCVDYGSTYVVDETQFRVSSARAVTDCAALLLIAARTSAGCRLELQYDSAVVPREIALQVSEGYARLAAALFDHPNRRVADFPCLSAQEEVVVLQQANQTTVTWGGECALHALVEAQAARTPEAIAIVSGPDHVTYRALDSLAERSAARLRAEGIRPDDRVGMMLRPSAALVAEMLGILKAGAAYVPIEPGYPVERLQLMIRDARLSLLLTDARHDISFVPPSVKVLHVEEAAGLSTGGEGRHTTPHHAELAAYVMYTSGSTGQPKGVVIPHGAIVNHMRWMARQFPLSADDAVLQKTPFSFDASVWEFWAPLMAGARLVLARPDGFRDVPYIVQQLIDERITVLQGVPSWLALLVNSDGLDRWSSARMVFAGGEPLDPSLATAIGSRTGAAVWNLYGPTETAIDSTFERCDGMEPTATVPIGLPIANTVAYVLDKRGWPAPRGSVGELHIGGDCLARGYLGRPDLTAERFVPDVFGGKPGGRLYRTGDLARRRLDLRLECLGRVDRQVKLRGVRVELGEVEFALMTCAGVRRAAVKVAGEKDDQRLVAFVETDGGGCDERSVRDRMLAIVPAHLVPSRFVMVPELPRLPNGKIDHAALIEPPLAKHARGHRAPRTEIETRVSSVWCDVLRLDDIDTDVNFFDIGGNSLLLLHAHQRLTQVCDQTFSVVDLFQYPTVRSFAAYLESIAARAEAAKS